MARGFVTTVAVSLFLIAPVAAGAKPDSGLDYHGGSKAGKVRLQAASNGAPKRVVIYWRAKCEDGVLKTGSSFTFEPGPAVAAISLEGSYAIAAGHGLRARIHAVGGGKLAGLHDRWAGRFRASAVILDNGHRIDRCQTRKLRWSADLVRNDYERGGQIVFDSQDEHEEFTQGEDSTGTLEDSTITPRKKKLTIKSGLFVVSIGVRNGIAPGSYTVERAGGQAPPQDASVDMEYIGDDCGSDSGSFTVNRYTLIRRTYDIDYALEYHCYNHSAMFVTAAFHRTPPPFGELKSSARAVGATPVGSQPEGGFYPR
jgi:hypothetical protein